MIKNIQDQIRNEVEKYDKAGLENQAAVGRALIAQNKTKE